MNYDEYIASLPATFEEFYEMARNKPPFDCSQNWKGFNRVHYENGHKVSDQAAHLPLLELLARDCSIIVQTGEREGYSSAAFAAGLAKNNRKDKFLMSIDETRHAIQDVFDKYKFPCERQFVQKSVHDPDLKYLIVPECDLLFIDSFHSGTHVKKELENLGHWTLKYLVFHDTLSQGGQSLDAGNDDGINWAIEEYTKKNHFELLYECYFNHGLRVYKLDQSTIDMSCYRKK